MRPGLQLKISQQLTMTPQLQQAIKLLQLSTLELRQEVIEQLYSNPLLEMDEDQGQPDSQEQNSEQQDAEKPSTEGQDVNFDTDDPSLHSTAADATELTVTESEASSDWDKDSFQDLPVDANWDEVYSSPAPASSGGGEINLEQVYQVTESLQDHLHWQLNLTPFSDRDREIAEAFIDAINDNGFINSNLEDITHHIDYQDPEDALVEDELVAVLKRLQQFDPPGVFARDIRESLLIQLNQLSLDTPYIDQAKRLTSEFIADIASVELSRLSKKTGYSDQEAQEALSLIRSLNPRPGEALAVNDAEYIVPDVYVEKIAGRWRVQLNDSNMPKLRINDTYSNLIKRSDNSDQNQFLKNNLAEARWFLRSLESRNETLMRVAMTIIDLQQGFLDHGPVAMKPMVLSDIASKLDLHESTISRVTTSKYMATPQGIYELKYFFSSHVGTSGGGECSSTAVCAILKTMISAEQPAKPLSDNRLTSLLEEQGIQVARRTVAKYRESMGIPSSSQRKRFENAK
ncbi:MAG: RNA polymerase factor sigma-54 [Porticoccaceae bacterium]|jgi:RNA polymerase sigma-54 factor|nr:RNA polymerase factor sigma-54 [Porticoccaceae bacterium]MDA9574093.1 RNA polymerase factor sigma-54 [Porticoccaceae bacterium]MDG1199839.1 RNA polymerase factor sigma-54 [Porticoccaceae bacterium]MDG1706527.1 RNA polymerase factor sigma-54 [Porticoccaceae bacterium]